MKIAETSSSVSAPMMSTLTFFARQLDTLGRKPPVLHHRALSVPSIKRQNSTCTYFTSLVAVLSLFIHLSLHASLRYFILSLVALLLPFPRLPLSQTNGGTFFLLMTEKYFSMSGALSGIAFNAVLGWTCWNISTPHLRRRLY